MIHTSRCSFDSPRGHQLSARLDAPEEAVRRGTAVFAHCFTCSKDLKVEKEIAQALTAQGFAVLSFDFTGLGRSGGEFADNTFSADVEDLIAAAAYLERTLAAPSILVGHSLGGAAVLAAAGRIGSVRAVATIGAPADPGHVEHLLAGGIDDIEKDGQAEISIGGRSFMIGKSFVDDIRDQRLSALLPRLGKALLVMHSPVDQTVGVDNARIIYDAAKHPKSFVSLDSADHLLTDARDAHYVAGVIAAWAERYLPEAPPSNSYEQDGATAITRKSLETDVLTRGFVLKVDEPESVGGTEMGPTPYDYLTGALASCTTLTLRLYADRKGYPLKAVTAKVTHGSVHSKDCNDCEHESGRIERFEKVLTLEGPLDDEQKADLVRIADRCPVHRTLHGQIEVHTTLED